MGNAGIIAVHRFEHQSKNRICGSCWTTPILDRDELAIHKEVGIPRGRLCNEAMKYLDPNERHLMFAASGNNPQQIKQCINQGASPDTYDENRTSPLHIACRQGSLDIVKELINQRASINITDCAGWTSLHIAAYCCRPDVVELLLANGSDATISNRKGETPWDLAGDDATQNVFLNYWQHKVEEDEPLVPAANRENYEVMTAQKAFPRPISPLTEEKSVISVKNWVKVDQIPTGLFSQTSPTVLERGKRIFNNNANKGLSFFIVLGLVSPQPSQIARFFYTMPGISPVKVGELLGETDQFHKEIAKEYISLIQFEKHNLLVSLRKLLMSIKLPRDGIMADQILDAFSDTFWSEKGPFLSKDSVHHLAFSIIMLDFSLHDHTSSPLDKEEFIKSNAGMHDGEDFPEKFLIWVYDEVKRETLRTKFEEQVEPVFDNVVYSGHLAYKSGSEWKERYFVLSDGILWFFMSTTQATPYGLIPLQGLNVHFDTRLLGFTIGSTIPFPYVKFSEDGSIQIQTAAFLSIKAGNLKLWLEGFQKVSNIRLSIK